MSPVISVAMADMQAHSGPAVLETVGIGSCLVIILYDAETKVGGLGHAMLPVYPAGTESPTSRKRYVDSTVDDLIQNVVSKGASKGNLIAKIVGGAHMFSLYGDAEHGIGARNIEQAKITLKNEGIPIVGEETGGTVGRNVRFDLETGVCSVETRM